ncbi:MAG: hypothetical protein KJ674_04930 [Nanoarchaeota archaeon]|nr:hypothetical protein [Nanoarchaeota archaeon]
MKRTTKIEADKFLSNVPEEHNFWCNNGAEIKNLKELEIALRKMDDDTHDHHVNKERNDFHNWIRDIVQDEKLANELTKKKNRKSTHKTINNRVKILKNLTKRKKK